MFGSCLKLDVRGTSHAKAIRFSLASFPAGLRLDAKDLAAFMARRAPGRDTLSTARRERDEVEFLAGFRDGVTTGETIVGRVKNTDVRAADYGANRTVPRPSHADFGQWVREGRIPTGGGKNSGRLTVALCAAGGLCRQALVKRGIEVSSTITRIGEETCPDRFEAAIDAARRDGDSVGGVVRCVISSPPVGLGGALFEGLESALSAALFAIPGVRAVSFGEGLDAARSRGSAFNDAFTIERGEVKTTTNRHGGILGGVTSGMPIVFDVFLKPTPTIFKEQESVDLATGQAARLAMKGRHDPCIVRRAQPVVEALAAFTLLDAILADEKAHSRICLTLTGKTLQEDIEQFQRERLFVDLVELRADLLTARERKKAFAFPDMLKSLSVPPRPVPVILTMRRVRDGGAATMSEQARATFFAETLAKGSFAYVDFEDDFRDAKLTSLARERGTRIVRSLHDFTGPVPNLTAKVRSMVKGTDEIAKVAFMPRTLDDVARLFSLTFPTANEVIVIAMGPKGLATRVLASRLNAPWTYASSGDALATLGHVSPQELVRDYRVRVVSRGATLFGVTGFPLAKTRSPELHNAAFAREDEDAVMIPFPSETAREALRFMEKMKMRGLAVTIPHKKAVMPLLDRCDALARRVGAVNTVTRDENGRLVGSNTDVTGFAQAFTSFAGDVRGKKVALLGAGGAAQAVLVALRDLGAKVMVFHRTTPPAAFDILVNATPVDPIPDYVFSGRERVYDLRYVPEETPLMARARRAGCPVENGFSMLAAQATRQRQIWFLTNNPNTWRK